MKRITLNSQQSGRYAKALTRRHPRRPKARALRAMKLHATLVQSDV